jgi:hypothetical protein
MTHFGAIVGETKLPFKENSSKARLFFSIKMLSLAQFISFNNMKCHQARVHKLDEMMSIIGKFVPTVKRDESGRIVTPRQLDGFNCGVGFLVGFLVMYDTESLGVW